MSWTVEANKDAVTGSKIEASGRVLLNNAPPQVSNIVTYSIDSVAPATSLTATLLEPGSSNYNVQWQATDDEPAGVGLGSGVRHVTVYVSEDGGEYRIWLRQTTDTQGVYRGQVGHTYTFLALATDNAGNKETPPLGASAPDDGSGANLGALPTVASSSPDDDPPPAPPPPQVLPPNPLFVLAQQGVPSAPPATKPGEYQTVLRPFTVNAFATGIGESRAGIGPMAIVELPDGSFLASGGSGRNQLFHLTREGGTAGNPLATLSQPIFALAMDSLGRLWAATGGGPLLQLDPSSGAILGQFGDSVTQAVAVDPASGKVFVSSGKGIEIFDPATGRFSHFSDERVGNLAFALDGTLWGTRWPNRGAVLRFNNKGKAETITRFDAPIDSLAFGRAGTKLEGLLFVTSNRGELFLVDVNTRQQLIVARGGSRGDVVTATGDGRILLSQSHQIDVFKPLIAPRVLSVNPPPDVTVPLPLASISVTFDQDMLTLNPTDPRSVLNPRNYRLQGDSVGPIQLIQLQAVAYDRASRTAVLTFEPLRARPLPTSRSRGIE